MKPAGDPLIRFSKYVLIDEGCWLWTGQLGAYGYGRFFLNGQKQVASRAAWLLLKGAIPPTFEIDHICKNTTCVNPAHLRVVTKAENLAHRVLIQTHCRQGHPLTADNLMFERGGKTRRCKICRQKRNRK